MGQADMSIDELPHRFNASETPILYHYTSVATARAMVEKPALWLSEHTHLNDTSEFSYGRNRLIALMQARDAYVELSARLYLGLALREMESSLGLMVGSLTARRDDLGQWRAYAEGGAGCVVAVDAGFLRDEAGVAMRTVIYDTQTVDTVLKAGLTVLQETVEDTPEDVEAIMETARWLTSDLFTIKHPGFADEREVRISRMLVPDESSGLIDVGGNRSGGGRTPALPVLVRDGVFGQTRYLSLPLITADGRSAIRGVGLGPAMSPKGLSENRDWFSARGVETWASDLPFRR